MNYRITVGGCRDYNDYNVFRSFMDECLSELHLSNNITTLSGHCSGVDSMAEKYAVEKSFELELYPAEWEKYGKFAGPKRNRTMVENCDIVIAFWDNCSKGTKNLIECAIKLGIPTKIKDISY